MSKVQAELDETKIILVSELWRAGPKTGGRQVGWQSGAPPRLVSIVTKAPFGKWGCSLSPCVRGLKARFPQTTLQGPSCAHLGSWRLLFEGPGWEPARPFLPSPLRLDSYQVRGDSASSGVPASACLTAQQAPPLQGLSTDESQTQLSDRPALGEQEPCIFICNLLVSNCCFSFFKILSCLWHLSRSSLVLAASASDWSLASLLPSVCPSDSSS